MANTHVPCGLGDVQANAKAYDEAIVAAGGIDLQLLGIGHNGHIGFNEPNAKEFIYPTNIITSPNPHRSQRRFFDGDLDKVPKQAISLGIGNIMLAKHVIPDRDGQGQGPDHPRYHQGQHDAHGAGFHPARPSQRSVPARRDAAVCCNS
jgi:glucosamine-6-phosphate deaminase